MSLPIRILFLVIVVPAALLAFVGRLVSSQTSPSRYVPVGLPAFGVTPRVAALTPADAALYVEQRNDRADVTCSAAQYLGVQADFTCLASDGTTWEVRGTTQADLNATVTTPSMFRRSALFDAHMVTQSADQCRRFTGVLPDSFGPTATSARIRCGRMIATLYLRPEDSVTYQRTGRDTYRFTVAAGNGETVSYDNTTQAYR
jgi:hypothetical protein